MQEYKIKIVSLKGASINGVSQAKRQNDMTIKHQKNDKNLN